MRALPLPLRLWPALVNWVGESIFEDLASGTRSQGGTRDDTCGELASANSS